MNAKTTAAKTALVACSCSKATVRNAETGELLTTGCTAQTKRTFAPGHDARLKGFLIRAGIADHEVRFGNSQPLNAVQVAEMFGFGHLVEAGIKRGMDREFAKLLKETKRQAKATHVTTRLEVTCKVGRWTYEGFITDDPMHGPKFTYTTKAGVQTTTQKFTRV
jgi:hypothetical protein